MNRANARTLAVQGAPHMHQARVIRRRADFSVCVQNRAQLGIGIFEGEGAAEATALRSLRQFNQVKAAHCPQ